MNSVLFAVSPVNSSPHPSFKGVQNSRYLKQIIHETVEISLLMLHAPRNHGVAVNVEEIAKLPTGHSLGLVIFRFKPATICVLVSQ